VVLGVYVSHAIKVSSVGSVEDAYTTPSGRQIGSTVWTSAKNGTEQDGRVAEGYWS
jgi:hypothetical protein